MKNILFFAIVMMAFTGTSTAQTKTEDKDCANKRDKFIEGEKKKGTDEATAKKRGQTYYNGCVDGKKAGYYLAPYPRGNNEIVLG